MAKNRVCYLLVLLFTGLFFVCFNGYFSLYVFALAVFLPVLSIFASLPGILGLRMELTLGNRGVPKGGRLALRFKVWSVCPLPGGRAKAQLIVKNTLTGQEQRETFYFTPGKTPQVFEHALSSSSCGLVKCELSKARAFDLLGLFAFPLPRRDNSPCAAFFYPSVYSPALFIESARSPDAEGERYSQAKPGNDPSELFGLRNYQDGDRLSRVHWKLSQKTGRLLVKEFSLPLSDHILFLLDFNGTGLEADTLLDAFATLSNFLAEQGVLHRAGFQDAASGRFQLLEITSPEDAQPGLEAVLSAGGKAPLSLPAPDELPRGASHVLYLCRAPSNEAVRFLQAAYPSARLTVLFCGEEQPSWEKGSLFAQAECVSLASGNLVKALNGLKL